MIITVTKDKLVSALTKKRDELSSEIEKNDKEIENFNTKYKDKITKAMMAAVESGDWTSPYGSSATVSVTFSDLKIPKRPDKNNALVRNLNDLNRQLRQLDLLDGDTIKIKDTDDYFRYV
jgi:hypothetical protein